jgi:endo-beta-N-acetylglucosaminidase D
LANDFKLHDIDLSTQSGVYNVNDVSLFRAIEQTSNGTFNNNALDTNAIVFQYSSDGTGTDASFVNWNWTNSNFGIGGSGVNQTESLKC